MADAPATAPVSVVITAYNAAPYIQEAIASNDPVMFFEPKSRYWQKGETLLRFTCKTVAPNCLAWTSIQQRKLAAV